jgi:hypothetical protein
MLRSYFSWVRANEAKASSLEFSSRTMALVLGDPTNIVQMESLLLLAKLHALSNQIILGTANHVVSIDEVLSYGRRIMSEMECWIELALRQRTGHASAWRFVVLWLLSKVLLGLYMKRSAYKRMTRGMLSVANSALGIHNKDGRRPDPDDDADGGSSAVVVPRVSVPRRQREALGSSPSDYLACVLDTFLVVRPLLLAFLAARAYPAHAGGGGGEPFGGIGSLRSPLRSSLLADWRVWGTVAGLEVLAAVGSFWLKAHHVPLVTASRSASTPADEARQVRPPWPEEQAASSPSSASAAAIASAAATTTVESARLQRCFDALLFSFLRDPFFSVVLKEFVHRHLVTGWISRWVPMLGWILASQTSYHLTLQHNSFLYTIGPS